VDEMCIKATRKLAIMKLLTFKLDRGTLQIMYKTFGRPVFEYADVVWDIPVEGDHTLDRLEVI
jgi:hypothetical protein